MHSLGSMSGRKRRATGIALMALALAFVGGRRLSRGDGQHLPPEDPPILGGVVLTVIVIVLVAGIAYLVGVRTGATHERVLNAVLVSLGLLGISGYYVASRFSTIGALADIDGGLILLIGYGALEPGND